MSLKTKNICCRDLPYDRKSGAFSADWTHRGATPAKHMICDLRPAVQVDGKWLEPAKWSAIPGGFTAAMDGVKLNLSVKPAGKDGNCHWLQGRVQNNSGVAFHFGGFRFRLAGRAGGDDFLSLPGKRLRLYREGWTGISAAGTVRFGEPDYNLDPGYLPFAVSAPAEYDGRTPNRYSAEYTTVLNDSASGVSVLLGFISSADQITRFTVEMSADGTNKVDAFSCGDGVLVDPGASLPSEELVIMSGLDGYALLEDFAGRWGRRMGALKWDHAPTGWCSWYYYFEKITESDMLENVKFLKGRRAEYPLEYIQLDDGYQSALGDWLVCNEKFPHGLKFLGDEIRAAGFKPAIWLAPFMVEERSKLYAAHPDWMLRDKDGQTVWPTEWRGSRVAVLDCSRPEALDWLRTLFGTLASWGYVYVKLDFMMYECSSRGGVYADEKITRAQACRKGLEAIRAGLGAGFIVGATMPLGPAVGIVNGERIGTDITPYWKPDLTPLPREAPCVANAARNVICHRYMHGKLWVNDPDVHICRIDNNKLTYDEVVLWTTVLWISGGMLLLSDRMSSLDPERAKLCRTLLNSIDAFYARPLDFFESAYPSVWLGKGRQNGETLVGLFNFEDSVRSFSVRLDQAGIEPGKITLAWDFWADRPFVPAKETINADVPPHSCKLLRFKQK